MYIFRKYVYIYIFSTYIYLVSICIHVFLGKRTKNNYFCWILFTVILQKQNKTKQKNPTTRKQMKMHNCNLMWKKKKKKGYKKKNDKGKMKKRNRPNSFIKKAKCKAKCIPSLQSKPKVDVTARSNALIELFFYLSFLYVLDQNWEGSIKGTVWLWHLSRRWSSFASFASSSLN